MKLVQVGGEEIEVERIYNRNGNVVAYDENNNVILTLEGVNLSAIQVFDAAGNPDDFDGEKTETELLREQLQTTQSQVDELILQSVQQQLGGGLDVGLLS